MFIALYHIIKNWALPSIAVATTGLASTVAVIIIMIIGIRMVLSLFNVTTSGRTSGILVKAAIDAIGYTCKKVVEAIGWVIRKVVAVTPKIYVKGAEQHYIKSTRRSNRNSVHHNHYLTTGGRENEHHRKNSHVVCQPFYL